ncbi:uncharacterized protein LOC121053620 [Oryza brachyantha]|uniref:uncharacterized protein LOC121053620 n=1 Tax=Oryza brachyantha TaxID=4533 RepID=UPI001AD9BA34|nr:uncharacterized protein LOC121053620 [Oryza brachyantha]
MALVGGKVVAAKEPGVARRLWRVVRAVLYMLRRGLPSGRKLAMDLHLLIHRGKIAGKALGELVMFHQHGHGGGGGGGGAAAAVGSSLSCRAIDPALAVYDPTSSRGRREVEFSCSNTPSSTTGGGGGLLGRRRRNRHHRRDDEYSHDSAAAAGYYDYGYDAAYVARVFEMLNDSEHLFNDDGDALAAAPTTTDETPLWTPARSRSPAPAATASRRHARITDSPFSASGGDNCDDSSAGGGVQQVDRKADEFIKRFYEQLRAQRSVAATPDYYGASPYSARGRTPRPVAAGIA